MWVGPKKKKNQPCSPQVRYVGKKGRFCLAFSKTARGRKFSSGWPRPPKNTTKPKKPPLPTTVGDRKQNGRKNASCFVPIYISQTYTVGPFHFTKPLFPPPWVFLLQGNKRATRKKRGPLLSPRQRESAGFPPGEPVKSDPGFFFFFSLEHSGRWEMNHPAWDAQGFPEELASDPGRYNYGCRRPGF